MINKATLYFHSKQYCIFIFIKKSLFNILRLIFYLNSTFNTFNVTLKIKFAYICNENNLIEINPKYIICFS